MGNCRSGNGLLNKIFSRAINGKATRIKVIQDYLEQKTLFHGLELPVDTCRRGKRELLR
jgi:hypothetical protein